MQKRSCDCRTSSRGRIVLLNLYREPKLVHSAQWARDRLCHRCGTSGEMSVTSVLRAYHWPCMDRLYDPLFQLESEFKWKMSTGRQFQVITSDYGPRDTSPIFSVPIPSPSSNCSNAGTGMVNGLILFQKEDMRKSFDARAEGMFSLTVNQLTKLSFNLPCESFEHLILSGGLGQSPHVQRKLRQRYAQGLYSSQNARRMQVRVAPDHQLAICKGLVIDPLRRVKSSEAILGWRCCPALCGLICRSVSIL